MKKLLFLMLAAIMVSVSDVIAQEENYNMIIKMADGTTVYIKPNEVDSISFSNGAVSISGSSIDNIMEKIDAIQADLKNRIWSNEESIAYLGAKIADLEKNTEEISGDAVILNTETNEPYTHYVWDSEAGQYVHKPYAIGDLVASAEDAQIVAQDALHLGYTLSQELMSPLENYFGSTSYQNIGESLVNYLKELNLEIQRLKEEVNEIKKTIQ